MSESIDYYMSEDERDMLKRELGGYVVPGLEAAILVARFEERDDDAAGLVARVAAVKAFLEQLS